MATWSAAFINDLPDSSFLYIESGGEKDDQGKTTPRSLRHFPVKDADGNVDLPHLRNALSRIPQSNLPQTVKDRATAKAQRMLDEATRSVALDESEIRSTEMWDDEEVRFQIEDTGTGFTMDGPLVLYDKPSRLLGPADLQASSRSYLGQFGRRTFREIVHPGAFKKSLSETPDIVLLTQHNELGIPLGRTKAGTLSLTDTGTAVRARAELPDNELGRPVRDAVKRGDLGGISFRMGHVIEKWGKERLADGYEGPVRHLHEIQLRREISLVAFPGFPDAMVAIRQMADDAEVEVDDLAEAFSVLKTPEAKLTNEQRDLLMTAINARVDEPYIDPKLVQMRERLAALAAG